MTFFVVLTKRKEKVLFNLSKLVMICESKKGVTILLDDGEIFEADIKFDDLCKDLLPFISQNLTLS